MHYALSILVFLVALSIGETQSQAAKSFVVVPELRDLAPSVVRIERARPGREPIVGSGFLWKDQSTIVTAYHLVAGVKSVGIGFQQRERPDYIEAEVVSASAEFDVAILRMKRPVEGVTPLETTPFPWGTQEQLIVAGYALASNDLHSHSIRQNAIQSKTLEGLIVGPDSSRIKSAIEVARAPDLKQSVIAIEGGFLPGYSGAPVFLHKKVVGIGIGGLGGGTLNWGWIVSAERLNSVRPVEKVKSADGEGKVYPDAYSGISHLFDDFQNEARYSINASTLTASVYLKIPATKSPFAKFGTRALNLYANFLQTRDFSILSKHFVPDILQGRFPVTQDSPLAFDLSGQQPQDQEYAAFAALAAARFSFDCYAPTRFENKLSDLGAPIEPDLSFNVHSGYAHPFRSDTGVWFFVEDGKPRLALLIRHAPAGGGATVRLGVRNAALLFHGGCIVKVSLRVPDAVEKLYGAEIERLFEDGLSVSLQPGGGADMDLGKTLITHAGLLGDRKAVRIVRFPAHQ